MNIVPLYEYPVLTRETLDNGVRHYNCPDTGAKLPSVTTIISATSNKTHLKEWRERVGEKEANRQSKYGSDVGSLMHESIENHIMGLDRATGNAPMRVLSRRMANCIIEECLPHVDEIWGIETALYLPGLYAGTSDLVGRYKGVPSVIDHKSAKKMRKREDIIEYRDQLAAYIIAHNEKYGTEIEQGVVFMADREMKVQTFIYDAAEIQIGKASFLDRCEQFLLAA